MRTLRLSVALGLLVMTASCAAPSKSGGGDPGQISSSATMAPTAPPPTLPNRAEPDKRAVDLRPVRWTRAEAGAGRQLQVHYTITGRGECSVLGRVDVVETKAAITVTVLLGRLPSADCGGAQQQIAAPVVTVVTLRDPMGSRGVRDGAG
jgi:hypothetical protein